MWAYPGVGKGTSRGSFDATVNYHCINYTVVMPATAALSKVAAARGYGARIVQRGANSIEAFAEYERLLAVEGQVPVEPRLQGR